MTAVNRVKQNHMNSMIPRTDFQLIGDTVVEKTIAELVWPMIRLTNIAKVKFCKFVQGRYEEPGSDTFEMFF